jgi:MSHA biogenesis protein MshE
MVLVTGPTGSGKTTTLYGALNELNIAEKKIITVEDPVEYRLPRVNQVQVNAKIGLTFARILRTALRQDPDIVLVGEIRDQETAEIALRAAITGHLVLSTLHTNDAVSTAIRLIDMGIPGFMVATALEAIVAQRLIRRICESCVTHYEPSVQERAWLKNILPGQADNLQLKHGTGCPHCNNSGYRGRIGVFELLELDEPMADALRRDDASGFAKAAAASPNFRTLTHNALDYAIKGTTSLSEVLRVSSDDEGFAFETEEEIAGEH